MKKKDNLQRVILFASVIVLVGLLFNGYALLKGGSQSADDSDLQTEIEKGIEAYVKKQQDEYAKAQQAANQPVNVEGDFTDDDAVLGDKNAPVTLIEFSDYECPFCKRHFNNTYQELKKKYIDTGKVKLVFRDFPLSFHEPAATHEAMAAECVRDQKGDSAYFTFHDLVFENTGSNGQGIEESKLVELAKQAGANGSKFTKCLSEEKFKDEVKKDMADGQKAGVSGTPAFLINGRRVSGAQPFSAFESIIEEELAK